MTAQVPYVDIGTVMGSTADGTVVPSAYGDQVRDNLVALWYGWWFKATRTTSMSVAAGTWVLAAVTSFDTAYETGLTGTSSDGMVSLSSGWVVLNRAGIWLFSANDSLSTSGLSALMAVNTTPSTVGASLAGETHQEGFTNSFGAPFKVTTVPTYVSLWLYSSNISTLSAVKVEGIWMGDA